jgi:ribosomal protein S18 acetylase RimI-like enzyme
MLSVNLCTPDDYARGLGVLYHRAPAAQKAGLVLSALKGVYEGLIDLSGLWIAQQRGQLIGALLTQVLPGRAAAVWAPEVPRHWNRRRIARLLIQAALGELRSRGYRVAQALVDASSPVHATWDLSRGGMPHVTELTYLARATEPSLASTYPDSCFEWKTYGPATEQDFREVLSQTYVGSLDMPELEGIRSLEDVLASYSFGRTSAADYWFVGRLVGEREAAGVLLLTTHVDRDAWEVAYLGLTPRARGRGLGRASLAHALAIARPHTPRLELAVDVRNTPADRLYRRAGFSMFDQRSVHLAVFS